MKSLLLLRHGKAEPALRNMNDFDRALNSKGLKQATEIGQVMKEKGLLPNLIICSTALRAKMTAEQVIESGHLTEKCQFIEKLYCANINTIIECINRVANDIDCIMVIGHNPGFEELARLLTGKPIAVGTANLTHIKLPIENWNSLDSSTQGALEESIRPS